MGGLLALAAAVVWALLCAWLAIGVARLVPAGVWRALAGLLAFAAFVTAPFVDVALGTRVYNDYCSKANHVTIVGTVPVTTSVGFHTESGEWRLALLKQSQWAEHGQLVRQMDALVRWDHGENSYTRVSSVFPIYERQTRIYEASSGRLLAEFKSYHYHDGLFRTQILGSGKQCFPWSVGRDMYEHLFVLQRPASP